MATFLYTQIDGARDEHQRAHMVAVNQIVQIPKPSMKNEDVRVAR